MRAYFMRRGLRDAVAALEHALFDSGALPFDIGERWLFDGQRFMEREDMCDRWGIYAVRWRPVESHESRLAMMEAIDDAQLEEATS